MRWTEKSENDYECDKTENGVKPKQKNDKLHEMKRTNVLVFLKNTSLDSTRRQRNTLKTASHQFELKITSKCLKKFKIENYFSIEFLRVLWWQNGKHFPIETFQNDVTNDVKFWFNACVRTLFANTIFLAIITFSMPAKMHVFNQFIVLNSKLSIFEVDKVKINNGM